jgi:hypothetical protein
MVHHEAFGVAGDGGGVRIPETQCTIGKMLIYPDTYDLVNLSRGTACINVADLTRFLVANSHQIVFSMETLIELAAPLSEGQLLEVRRDLNRLEELPHTFVDEGRIYDMELREAVSAFEHKREYDGSAVVPFAPRLDEAVDLYGQPQNMIEGGVLVPTKMIVNLRMSEVILYLWKHDPQIFDVQRRREPEWIRVMESDRALTSPPALRDHFVTAMVRNLATHRIPLPAEADPEVFARWVYDSPLRCPGIRLTYETQHRFRRDKTAQPAASDIIDLARFPSIPYVDFFITDKKMMMYCVQAAKEIELPYRQLHGNLQAVLSHLGLR